MAELDPQILPKSDKSMESHFTDSVNSNNSTNMELFSKEQHPTDITSRQLLINQLLVELDKKTIALEKVGVECVKLRATVAHRDETIATLNKRLSENNHATHRLIKAFDVDIIPHEELKRRYALVAGKLEAALQRIDHQERRLKELADTESNLREIRKDFKKLELAHTAQQNLVLHLQESVQKGSKFKSIIQQQEKVISQMEAKLSTFRVEQIPAPETTNVLVKEKIESRKEIQELNKFKPQGDIRDTENTELKTDFQESKVADQSFLNWRNRAIKAELKVLALEQQLIESAKSFGREIGELSKNRIGTSR